MVQLRAGAEICHSLAQRTCSEPAAHPRSEARLGAELLARPGVQELWETVLPLHTPPLIPTNGNLSFKVTHSYKDEEKH